MRTRAEVPSPAMSSPSATAPRSDVASSWARASPDAASPDARRPKATARHQPRAVVIMSRASRFGGWSATLERGAQRRVERRIDDALLLDEVNGIVALGGARP